MSKFSIYIMARTSYIWWDDDGVQFVLDQDVKLDFVSDQLTETSLWINMSPHSDTLFWFQTNQSLFLLLNAACLVEKKQT
jgi:hypothetical protein